MRILGKLTRSPTKRSSTGTDTGVSQNPGVEISSAVGRGGVGGQWASGFHIEDPRRLAVFEAGVKSGLARHPVAERRTEDGGSCPILVFPVAATTGSEEESERASSGEERAAVADSE